MGFFASFQATPSLVSSYFSNGFICLNSKHPSLSSDQIRNVFFCFNSSHPSPPFDDCRPHTSAISSLSTHENPVCSSFFSGNHALHRLTRGAFAWTLTCFLCFGGIQGLGNSEFRAVVENFWGVGIAHAGLMQMPPEKLNNSYYLVRSGESEFEKIGIINTNPVMKTNVDNGLSENGKKQALKAALQLLETGACEGSCWIWPSITQRAYQAAEIIASVNNVSRSRIVPEYSFLDARGLGAYEGRSLSLISEVYKADSESPKFRPPPFEDGTPNESVADVVVRVTQLMSILETQYLGETVIIVAPDSDILSVLQAALTGLDLRRHSMLSFLPGEVRHVDLASVSVPRTRLSGLITCSNPPRCD